MLAFLLKHRILKYFEIKKFLILSIFKFFLQMHERNSIFCAKISLNTKYIQFFCFFIDIEKHFSYLFFMVSKIKLCPVRFRAWGYRQQGYIGYRPASNQKQRDKRQRISVAISVASLINKKLIFKNFYDLNQ